MKPPQVIAIDGPRVGTTLRNRQFDPISPGVQPMRTVEVVCSLLNIVTNVLFLRPRPQMCPVPAARVSHDARTIAARIIPAAEISFRSAAGATAGFALAGGGFCTGLGALQAPPRAARCRSRPPREGRRHTRAHLRAEVWTSLKDTPLAAAAKANLTGGDRAGPRMRAAAVPWTRGIDYQAINVTRGGTRGGPRARARPHPTARTEDRAACAARPRSLRGDATLPLQHRTCGRSARLGREKAGAARRRHRGSVEGQELSTASSIRSGQGGGARRDAVHASAARSKARPPTRGCRERAGSAHDRQSARDHP